jgi:ribonuclease P protein component
VQLRVEPHVTPTVPQVPSSSPVSPSSDASGNGHPRRAVLRASAQFQTVFRDGRRLNGSNFRLHVLPAAADALAADARVTTAARLGVTVSKRVDKHAVGRNRIRRQVRECFRCLRAGLPPGDYVVLALAAAARSDNAGLRDELLSLFERARTLKPRVPAVTLAPAVATDRPLPPLS